MAKKKLPKKRASSLRKHEAVLKEGDVHAQLLQWTADLFQRDGARIKPRVGVVRGRAMEIYHADDLVGGLGPEGIMQALALLARTAAADDFVFAVMRGIASGPGVDATMSAGTAFLYARSIAGAGFATLLSQEMFGRRWTGRVRTLDASKSSLANYGDFTMPAYFVDPLLENRLAKAGFPGAIDQLHAPGLLTAKNAPPAPAAAAPPPKVTPLPVRRMAVPRLPWQAGAEAPFGYDHFSLSGGLIRLPPALIPAAPPDAVEQRSITELLARSWSSEAQAAHVIRRLRHEMDRQGAFERMLVAPFSEALKLFWSAAATALAQLMGDMP